MSVIEAIAQPSRRRILDALLDGERLVGDLADELGMAQPNVSKHLAVLHQAELVKVRPEAQRRWYSVQPGPLREVDAWLAPYRQKWANTLDALERHLEETR